MLLLLALLHGDAFSARTDSLFRAGEAESSYAAAMAHVAIAPSDYDALWRAARAEVTRGVLSSEDAPAKARIYESGEAFAHRAIARNAGRAEAHYWLAAAMGLHADNVSPLSSARLAAGVHREALRIVEIDSLYAGGHALLGKLHSNACTLNPFMRFLAAAIVGGSVMRSASCAAAERELARAIALDSGEMIFRVYMAELLVRTHRIPAAEDEVALMKTLPPRTPADTALLHSIGGVVDHARTRP